MDSVFEFLSRAQGKPVKARAMSSKKPKPTKPTPEEAPRTPERVEMYKKIAGAMEGYIEKRKSIETKEKKAKTQ